MYILNTTFIVAEPLLSSFLQWAREVYLPAIEAAPSLSSPQMARVLQQVEPGAVSIAIQAHSSTLEEATRWHDETASLLRDDLHARFADSVLFFTTYMELLNSNL